MGPVIINYFCKVLLVYWELVLYKYCIIIIIIYYLLTEVHYAVWIEIIIVN